MREATCTFLRCSSHSTPSVPSRQTSAGNEPSCSSCPCPGGWRKLPQLNVHSVKAESMGMVTCGLHRSIQHTEVLALRGSLTHYFNNVMMQVGPEIKLHLLETRTVFHLPNFPLYDLTVMNAVRVFRLSTKPHLRTNTSASDVS